jgi:RNA polymerase sigma factor (sigma-70 family)
MLTENTYPELGTYADRLVQCKAAEVAEHYNLTDEEREDLEQDLALRLCERREAYDRSRAKWSTFAGRVVGSAIADLLETRTAAKRDPDRVSDSFDELVPDGEGGFVVRSEMLDYERHRREFASRTDSELRDLRLDLDSVIERSHPELRRICEGLSRSQSIRAAARLLGISNTTLHRRLKDIRTRFAAAGLADYFGGGSVNSWGQQ